MSQSHLAYGAEHEAPPTSLVSERATDLAYVLMYRDGAESAVDVAADWLADLIYGSEQVRAARVAAIVDEVRAHREGK